MVADASASMLPAATTPVARSRGLFALLALGMMLARRGILSSASIGICAFTTIVTALIGVALGSRGPHSPVHEMPILASSALAWGGGFLLAVAAAMNALRRDRADGVRDLVVARTHSLRGYVVARVGGLALLVALVVAGGTLATGLVSALATTRVGGLPRTLHATAAALVFAIAFAAVIAPLAFAALGARSRIGGYLFLLSVVMIPEVAAGLLGSALPESVSEVMSIPSALSGLRTALAPGTVDATRAARAAVAIALFIVVAILLVRRDAKVIELETQS